MRTTLDMETVDAAIHALELLGNYIGNEWKGGGGIAAFDRCAIIGKLREAMPINESWLDDDNVAKLRATGKLDAIESVEGKKAVARILLGEMEPLPIRKSSPTPRSARSSARSARATSSPTRRMRTCSALMSRLIRSRARLATSSPTW